MYTETTSEKSGCTPDQFERDWVEQYSRMLAAIKIYDLSVNFALRFDSLRLDKRDKSALINSSRTPFSFRFVSVLILHDR